jgi:hypothetical protein
MVPLQMIATSRGEKSSSQVLTPEGGARIRNVLYIAGAQNVISLSRLSEGPLPFLLHHRIMVAPDASKSPTAS